MPWRHGGPLRFTGPPPRSVARSVIVLALILGVGACSDDDAGPDAGPDAEPATVTTRDIIVEPTLALELNASADPSFIDGVVADDVVSSAELEGGYERFVACLVEGGAAGLYAYDIDLHVGLAADWSLPSATAGANDAASLEASCSRDYLGDLIERFYDANPAPADLAERQRASVVACVAAVDANLADALPGALTVDTTGSGANALDLQLDPTSIGAEPGQVEPVRRCMGALGVDWIEFG